MRTKSNRGRLAHGLLLVLWLSATGSGGLATATNNDLWDFGVAAQRVEDLKRAGAYLNALAGEPLPAGATTKQRTDGYRFAQWLRNTARKMHHLSRGWEILLSRVPDSNGRNHALIERLQEMNRGFSVQYLEMVARAREEAAAFHGSSAFLRERHERAMHLLGTLH